MRIGMVLFKGKEEDRLRRTRIQVLLHRLGDAAFELAGLAVEGEADALPVSAQYSSNSGARFAIVRWSLGVPLLDFVKP